MPASLPQAGLAVNGQADRSAVSLEAALGHAFAPVPEPSLPPEPEPALGHPRPKAKQGRRRY